MKHLFAVTLVALPSVLRAAAPGVITPVAQASLGLLPDARQTSQPPQMTQPVSRESVAATGARQTGLVTSSYYPGHVVT